MPGNGKDGDESPSFPVEISTVKLEGYAAHHLPHSAADGDAGDRLRRTVPNLIVAGLPEAGMVENVRRLGTELEVDAPVGHDREGFAR
jgi:hypothetical protein